MTYNKRIKISGYYDATNLNLLNSGRELKRRQVYAPEGGMHVAHGQLYLSRPKKIFTAVVLTLELPTIKIKEFEVQRTREHL